MKHSIMFLKGAWNLIKHYKLGKFLTLRFNGNIFELFGQHNGQHYFRNVDKLSQKINIMKIMLTILKFCFLSNLQVEP